MAKQKDIKITFNAINMHLSRSRNKKAIEADMTMADHKLNTSLHGTIRGAINIPISSERDHNGASSYRDRQRHMRCEGHNPPPTSQSSTTAGISAPSSAQYLHGRTNADGAFNNQTILPKRSTSISTCCTAPQDSEHSTGNYLHADDESVSMKAMCELRNDSFDIIPPQSSRRPLSKQPQPHTSSMNSPAAAERRLSQDVSLNLIQPGPCGEDLCNSYSYEESISPHEDEEQKRIITKPNQYAQYAASSLHADDESVSMKAEDTDHDHMLDDLAEKAAAKFFGARADQPMNDSSHSGLRSSKLVSNGPGIDPGVFAKLGLMSRKSFELYKKETKTKNKAAGRGKGMERRRRASMYDLRNDSFDIITPPLNRHPSCKKDRSSSLDSALADSDQDLVNALISSFKNAKGGKSQGDDKEPHTLLTADEKVVLSNMMKRLSQDDSPMDSPMESKCLDTKLNENVQKEKGKDSKSFLFNSYPDVTPAKSLAGDRNEKKPFVLNEVNFSREPSSSKQEEYDSHPTPEVELNTWISDTSALSLPQFEQNNSNIPASTAMNQLEALNAICAAPENETSAAKEFDDMKEHAHRFQIDGNKIARTPSIPQVRRSFTSESPARRASFTQVRSRRRKSTSSMNEESNHALSSSTSRASSSALLSAAMADLDGPPLKQDCGDLLAEGIEHLSMAMLVNIYGKLREMSLLGHVSVKLRDIDVNSHQYNSRKKEMKRLGEWTAEDEAKGYLDTTRNAGFIVRAVMDEHELFEAEHARGANSEINHALLAYDASLLKDFKTWVEESRVKQLDTATEGIIKRIREECSQRQMAREEMMSSNHSLPTSGKSNTSLRIAQRRGSLLDVSQSFQGASWMNQERKLIEDHFGIKNGLPASRRKSSSRDRLPGELSGSLISKAIEESSDAFFEEGSVMRNLLESGFEVVWFADRHPSDIIYGICVNRQTATVTVVFRGQDGIFDLCCKTVMSSFPNPIAHEDYEGNSECIKLRSAVADELLRVRMDTKMSLISEIREKVVIIGQELANGTNAGYHLSVVGHSRGGGYATVLGYYLASDMYLEVASAVRVFTFASSPVGCADFQKGFKHLEEEGRLVHARFANSNDLFTSLPLRGYSEENKSNIKYHHVGMQVRLHKANEAGRRRIKQSLDVSYDAREPLLVEMARAARNVLSLIKALICFVYTKNYCISQYHLRMHFAREYRLALGNGALRFDRKRKCLKSLNEYYVMKCRHVRDYTGFKEKPALLPTWAVYVLVACLLYVQIDIILKLSASW